MAGDDNDTWLSANAAIALVSAKYRRPSEAENALIEAAARGDVCTKCERSLIENERGTGWRYTDAKVDRSFWRALQGTGREHADWGLGEFTAKYRTQSDGNWQWTRLWGAQFQERELLAKFGTLPNVPKRPPPPLPASAAIAVPPPPSPHSEETEEIPAEPSEDEFADWLAPATALGMLSPRLGLDGAVNEIVSRLLADRIRAAGSASYHYQGSYRKDDRAPIPPSWWIYGNVGSPTELFWRTGSATFTPKGSDGRIEPLPFFGVRLEREGIYEILDAAGVPRPEHGSDKMPLAPEAPPSVPNHTRRGPKPGTHWAPLEAEIKAHISSGILRPSQLSDIEEAMKERLAEQDIYPSEATVRRHAQPIWKWSRAEAHNYRR